MHGPQILERMRIRSPLEHYRFCRYLLSQSDVLPEFILQALRYPYALIYQPSIAACALLSKRIGRTAPPVIPKLFTSNAPFAMIEEEKRDDCLLPISIAEELAHLWQELGLIEPAEKVGEWAGKFTGSARMLYICEETFFADEAECGRKEGVAADSCLGILSSVSKEKDVAISLTGWNSALGAMRFGDVEVPAFGPQMAPLSDAGRFGISHHLAHGVFICTETNHSEIEGWTRCHGCKESWFHLKAQISRRACDLSLSRSSGPIRLSFFIRARRCDIENSFFEPGSLHRYQGKIKPLLFNGSLELDCDRPDQELQIIPLAGKDCFWNANFLISYTCPPGEKILFRFSF